MEELPYEWYLELFDALGLGVAVYRAVDEGEDFEFIYINDNVERLERVSRQEVLGKRLTEAFPGVEEMGLLHVLRRVYQTKKPEHLKTSLYRDTRRAGWRVNYVFPLESGEVVAVYRGEDTLGLRYMEALYQYTVEIIRASSLLEVAEKTVEAVRGVLGYTLAGFMVVEGEVLRSLAMIGVPEGTSFSIDLNQRSVMVRAVKTGETQLVPDTRADPDWAEGPEGISVALLSELAVPVKVGGEVRAVINIEDEKPGAFTELDRLYVEALARYVSSAMERMDVEKDVEAAQVRVSAEREKAQEAERLNELKTVFMRTATHELRTPLTSILGYLELMREEAEALPEKVKQYLDIVQRNAHRLKKLTDDLLDHQLLQTKAALLRKSKQSLNKVVERAAEEMKPVLEKRSQELVVDVPRKELMVVMDEVRILQVLVNLINNASKYSPEGSQIRVKVVDEGAWVLVSVEDEGVGIRAEDMPRLFEPFPGIHVPGVKDSVGLGLSICRGIVELHGGRIWAESEGPGKGARFTFTLPKAGVDGDG